MRIVLRRIARSLPILSLWMCLAEAHAGEGSSTTAPKASSPSCPAGFQCKPTVGVTRFDSDAPICVAVTMPGMPPSRTWCTLESPDGRRTATGEWDPLRPSSLKRELRLAATEADAPTKKFSLSCYSEAIRPTLQPERNLAWKFATQTWEEPKNECTQTEEPAPTNGLHFWSHQFVAFETPDGARLSIELDGCAQVAADEEFAGVGSTPKPQLGTLRSFSPGVASAATESFQLIADVVLRKVEERALQVVAKQIEALVCDPGLPFPMTCQLVRTTRLRDLATSGQDLERAVVADLVRIAVDKVKLEQRPQPRYWSLVELGLTSAAQLVTRPDRASSGSSEVILALLHEMKDGDLATLRVVIQECHRSGSCDAGSIRHRLRAPNQYYRGDKPLAAVTWAPAQAFVLDALMLLSPPAERSESENLRSALQLVLDASEFGTSPGSASQRVRSEHWRALVLGLTERDLSLQLSAVAGLLDSRAAEPSTVRRLATIVSALGGQATSGETPATPEERQAQRDAREDAIGSLVDEFASRRQRRGDWIVSVGSSLGALVGGTFADEGRPSSFLATPVLSLGPAIDYHAPGGVGFHAEFAPLDLGAYLSYKSNRNESSPSSDESEGAGVVDTGPGDVLRPSLAAGITYLFEDSDLILIAGGRIGYAMKPGAGEGDEGPFAAVMAGAYVPLLDFN
jgi:hypothetical protein